MKARITSFNAPDWAGYAGLMIREIVSGPDAARSKAVVTVFNPKDDVAIPDDSSRFTGVSQRPWTNDPARIGAFQSSPSAVLPHWIRMVRFEDQISIFVSGNGTNWEYIDGESLTNLASSVFIGMYSTSQAPGTFYTATFDQVSVTSLTHGYNENGTADPNRPTNSASSSPH